MQDKNLVAKNTHSTEEIPENSQEVYVCTKDKKIILCEYRSGCFWLDYYAVVKKEEILFWAEDIVFE